MNTPMYTKTSVEHVLVNILYNEDMCIWVMDASMPDTENVHKLVHVVVQQTFATAQCAIDYAKAKNWQIGLVN